MNMLEGTEEQKQELQDTEGQKHEPEDTKGLMQKLNDILEKIAANPLEWVLFLGNGISYKKDYRRQQLYELARKLAADKEVKDSVKCALYEAVQDKDDMKISEILFGNIWDNASFLEEQQEKQQERRRSYAKKLVKRDEVNVDWEKIHLKHLFEIFSGIILTTCQDETIEAFLEYQKSMPVDDLVCTPYIMNTSSRWDDWLQTGQGDVTRFLSEEEMQEDVEDKEQENVYILVKLYGSSNMPHRMLLSKQDFEAYYPDQLTAHTRMMKFLKTVFETKNLLFLGMEFEEDGTPLLAKGILELLKAKKEDGKEENILQGKKIERYAVGDVLNIEQLKDYQIDPICGAGVEVQLNDLCKELKKGELPKKDKPEDDKELSGEEVLEQFGRYYIRRPCKGIFPKEQYEGCADELMKKELEILKNDILGVGNAKNGSKAWCHMSVWQLAAAANNLADFYDLKQIFQKAEQEEIEKNPQGQGNIEFYKNVTRNILKDRLSEKSLSLHGILSVYGEGFPWGFLQFLQEDEDGSKEQKRAGIRLAEAEDELKEWKRAGIRLANSGIYKKSQRRKTIQKRMSYADRVMSSAGEYPKQKRLQFQNQMEQICQQTGNSYFYPFENVQLDEKMDENKIINMFEKMFLQMLDILKDKQEGYQQLHSLLQTETEVIFDLVIDKMGDYDRELEWKPLLVHSLLLESRMMPIKHDRLEEKMLKPFWEITKGWKEDADPAKSRKKFEIELHLHQIEIIKWSHLLGKNMQGGSGEDIGRKIKRKCDEVDDMLKKKREGYSGQDTGSIPEWLFEMQTQFMILKSRIHDRLSSVAEIERCRQIRDSGEKQETEMDVRQIQDSIEKQKAELDDMHEHLCTFEEIIENREKVLGCTYEMLRAQLNHLWGRYHFKMSQFYWENRKFNGNSKKYEDYKDEDSYYQKAEEAYEQALQYYSKYPSQYGIQRADVMRDIADMNCQKYKGLKDVDMDGLDRDREKERTQAQDRCYDMLMEAYILYRNNPDLHGIADVLQSMGNAEPFDNLKGQIDHRSPFSFHEAAKSIYKYLRDEWSWYVVSEFVQGVLNDRIDRSSMGAKVNG